MFIQRTTLFFGKAKVKEFAYQKKMSVNFLEDLNKKSRITGIVELSCQLFFLFFDLADQGIEGFIK